MSETPFTVPLRFSSKKIDYHAKDIVKKLQSNGYITYLVGGCVRDLIVGQEPKDFDISTSAPPEKVKRTIRYSFIIGRRFRLVLVRRNDRDSEKQFEVSTFRRAPKLEETTNNSSITGITGDNFFGSPQEDAHRRDFTVNALFYDCIKNELIDYCDGLKDIKDGFIRVIGDPDTRLKQDPIRIFRALRFAHKLRFTITPDLRQSMIENSCHLPSSSLPRRREEFLKLLRLKDPARVFQLAYDLDILKQVAPSLNKIYENSEHTETFECYLNRIEDFVTDFQNSTQVFCFLIFAIYRTMISDSPAKKTSASEVLENPFLVELMRVELGMFNHEQRFAAKVISLQYFLVDLNYYKKRTQRRISATLRNEAFEMALHIGQMDYAVIGETQKFWNEKQTNK